MARKSRLSTEVSRRKFLVTGTAAGGGLALGLHVPGLSGALAQKVLGTEGDEVGAWVFIRPNDDVVIRIARTEMGQGTLTGLAQLVAEELECDWKKVKTEMPTPGQNLARNRIWGDMSTGGSRGIRGSHEYVRKGGAAAREMLIEAAAAEWKVPEGRVQGRGQRHHAFADRPQDHLRQGGERRGQAAGARCQGHQAQRPERLEDRRQAAQAPRHGRQAQRPESLCHRRQAAWHAQRRHQGRARVRLQDRELRGGQGLGHAGRAPCREGQPDRGGGGGRHLVAGQEGRRSVARRLRGQSQQQGVERQHRRPPEGGPDRQGGARQRQQAAAMRWPPSKARPRGSRPSTPRRSSATPAWSR